MTPKQALGYALILFAGAGLCGLLLLHSNPRAIVPLAVAGVACAVSYPAFLKKFGLGDALIIVAFGIGLTLGAYAVQVPEISLPSALRVALLSVPVCLLVDAILHANNLRDAVDDRAAKVRTLATLLSPAAGQWLQRILLFGPLLFIVAGVAIRLLPVWSVATFLSFPLLLRAARSGSVPGTAQTHLVFGLLYTLSFLLPPAFV